MCLPFLPKTLYSDQIMRYCSLYLLFVLLLSGCVTAKPTLNRTGPVSKVVRADYQKIWRAVMLTLEDYPIETENNEKGYLKTEPILENTIWKLPFPLKKAEGKYTLDIRLIKGQSGDEPVVKVQIFKKIKVQKGFISEPEIIPSSGLEEKAILYRILRELEIEKAIAHYHQKKAERAKRE